MSTTTPAAPSFGPTSLIRRQGRADSSSPRAGRALHPSSHDDVDVLPIHAMSEIAEGLGQCQRPIARPSNDHTGALRSLRLLVTASYDVWLITWPPNARLQVVDIRGIVHVVVGNLVELENSQRRGWDRLHGLGTGDTANLSMLVSHAFANSAPEEATTVLVFSPPLADPTFFERQRVRHRTSLTIAPQEVEE
jgi:hypothetical protein